MMKMTIADYLQLPYARVLTRDATGAFVATIREFPGCIADGRSQQEALENLEVAAESWLEAALSTGYKIPEPAALNDYSGRFALRLPKSLHRRAAEIAEEEGTSLNQYFVAAIAHSVGADDALKRSVEQMYRRLWQVRVTSDDVLAMTHGHAVLGRFEERNTDDKWDQRAPHAGFAMKATR